MKLNYNNEIPLYNQYNHNNSNQNNNNNNNNNTARNERVNSSQSRIRSKRGT